MRSLAITCALVAVGCGDDGGGSLPDAPADSAVDAAVDADESLVTLTITDGGVPAVGATVYFQKPDSSLVRMSTTDADGKARAPMPDGGFVTAVEPRPTAFGAIVIRDNLSTFAGVKPGDDLHLDLRRPPASGSISVGVQVPDDPAAEAYEIRSSCGRGILDVIAVTTPGSVMLNNCGGIADMFVISTDLATTPLRSLYRPGQVVADGATLTFTGPYTDVVPTTVAFTATPAWVGSYVTELHVVSARGSVYSGYAAIDPTAPMATIPMPVAAGTTQFLRADLYRTPPTVMRATFLAWGLSASDHTFDIGATALRPIATRPVFDPATRTVSWTDEPGRNPDVVRAEVYTYREGDPARAWSWQLVAPYDDRPSVTYPSLPGEAATAFMTLATDSFSIPELEMVALDGGYDRIRAHALRQTLDAVPPGAAGQLMHQRLYEENLLVTPTLGPPATFTRGTR